MPTASPSHTSLTTNIKTRLLSLLFFGLYNLIGIVHSLLSLSVAPFQTFEQRYWFVNLWSRATMWLLQRLNGVNIEVDGLENIPKGKPVVVMCNHQSQWETFYLQILVSPQATILKRELLWVPFFGWALILLRPIAIDRSKGSQALKTLLRAGQERLQEGISVVIYPEGTRQSPGTIGRFNLGGAMLAARAGVEVLPMCHNSGDCWPSRSLLRLPGTIRLRIGQPIATEGKSPKQISAEVEAWIRQHYPGELRSVATG
ncbi:lysophospholipid acyltransferase family protein [Lamprobacter modestohalophilus]|uniref:1-acyl-sn-glycerol-3-phosphate acyltransferase n=1 Tax=Lamprobacter modestohalophilus TaxID=1064514 RepID=A0A9X0WA03_9GAMM|nr:lysophospholipid acyltransferase family protein [Lamprobacter modestohalophilus]MBK1619659.1 1-acyl-sn-glycerol-3-phosphate acyltransferase [Lamprobacter modestohalophilus]MEA1049365.1 lysophospholipid acyltransferase family protein [Lamprobacter modestohalophilus]